jgi:hypothetical protein
VRVEAAMDWRLVFGMRRERRGCTGVSSPDLINVCDYRFV